jgi:hypothetical protein
VLVYVRPDGPGPYAVPVTSPTSGPAAPVGPPRDARPEPITHEFVFRMKKV